MTNQQIQAQIAEQRNTVWLRSTELQAANDRLETATQNGQQAMDRFQVAQDALEASYKPEASVQAFRQCTTDLAAAKNECEQAAAEWAQAEAGIAPRKLALHRAKQHLKWLQDQLESRQYAA